jgi:hypothetical protein
MIKIERSITISKLNDLYRELEVAKEGDIDLYLPKLIDSLNFGVLFSYLQFLATWVRNERSGKLHLPVGNVDEAVTYLEDHEFVYPSLVLAWEKPIVGSNGEDLKSGLKDPSKSYFLRMDFFELKGRSVPIYCFDHDKSNRGLSKHFYKSSRELVTEDALGFNLFRAFTKVGAHNEKVFRDSLRKHYDSFIAIIHELFSNTHEHAKTNQLGHNLYPNIRAVHLKYHFNKAEVFGKIYQDFVGMVDYFNSEFKLNSLDQLYLVEISILDSGPGLAKRYTGKSNYDISVEQEVDIIKQCLYRHNTSSEGSRAEVKGIGLDRVLQTIDGKGFVRIRSGRVDIFRDMKNCRYIHHNQASDIQVNDLRTNSTTNFSTYPPVEGTLISIFYPLTFEPQ